MRTCALHGCRSGLPLGRSGAVGRLAQGWDRDVVIAALWRGLPADVPASRARLQALLLMAELDAGVAHDWEWSGWLPRPSRTARTALDQALAHGKPGRGARKLPWASRSHLAQLATVFGRLELAELADEARSQFAARAR